MEGRTLSFGESDLAATVTAYDPALSAAPLVIGYPTRDDAPAYGWVGGLVSDGGILSASFSQISQEAKALVDAGHYRNVSASFYAPSAASNPVPGTYYLRHVGLLGAVAPAVKGLGSVSFASAATDSADDIVTVSFGEMSNDAMWSLAGLARSVGRWMRRMRDQTIASDGLEVADRLAPEWDVADAEGVAARIQVAIEVQNNERALLEKSSFSDPVLQNSQASGDDDTMTPEEIAALKAENETLKASNVSFSEAAVATAKAARTTSDTAFIDGLVAKGCVAPAHSAGLVSFMATLGASDTVSFSEGTAAQTPLDYFKGALSAAQPIISFSEIGAPTAQVVNGGDANAIAAGITKLVNEAAARGETLSFADASVKFTGTAV